MNSKHLYQLTMLSFFCLSCHLLSCEQKRNLTENELKSYVGDSDNGLLKRIETEELIIDCFYWPKELILSNEYKNSSEMNDSTIQVLKHQLDSIDYFMIKYSPKQAEYKFANTYNDIQNRTKLIIDMDTVQLEDAITIPKQNSASQSYTTLYAFKSFLNKRPRKSDVYIVINENGWNEKIRFFNDNIHRIQNFSILINK